MPTRILHACVLFHAVTNVRVHDRTRNNTVVYLTARHGFHQRAVGLGGRLHRLVGFLCLKRPKHVVRNPGKTLKRVLDR